MRTKYTWWTKPRIKMSTDEFSSAGTLASYKDIAMLLMAVLVVILPVVLVVYIDGLCKP